MADAPDFIPDSEFPADQVAVNSAPAAPSMAMPPSDSAPAQTPSPNPGVSASPDFIPDDQFSSDEDKYSTPGQKLKTFLEGATEGIAGPIATFAEKRYLGVDPKDMLARREENPITHGVGQVAGLLSPVGEGAIMAKAGEKAVQAVGLAAPKAYFARVGSEAIRQAAEMAVLQSSDEISKKILQDESGSTESAIANIGMAAALGGATGAVFAGALSPLWKATVGSKLDSFLENQISRMGGKEVPPTMAEDLAAKSGVSIPPELAAKINGGDRANLYHSKLSQTDHTIAGRSLQKTESAYRSELGEQAAQTFGHDADYVREIGDVDKYGTGQKQVQTLHKELEDKVAVDLADYAKVNKEFKNQPVSGENMVQMRNDLAQINLDNGWNKLEETNAFTEKTVDQLARMNTAEDLKSFITNLRDRNPYGSENFKIARAYAHKIEDGVGRTIAEGVSTGKGSLTPEAYEALRGRYKQAMEMFEALDEHLKVGKWDGPRTFLNALQDLGNTKGEIALGRLSGKNRAEVLQLLNQYAPQTLGQVRQYHVDRLLKLAKDPEGVSATKLLKALNNEKEFSPQIKDLIATPEARAKLEAISEITNRLKDDTHNFSNTARTLGKNEPISPLEMIASVMGHGGAAVMSHLGKLGFSEGADGARLGILRMIGSNQPVKSEGLKSAVSFFNHVYKGENQLANAAKAVLKPGAQVLATHLVPDSKDREKLDKQVSAINKDPNKMFASQSDLGHYAPGHQAAMSKTVAAAQQYLHDLKPKGQKMSPLDRELPPTPAQTARYNRALDIAQQPALVLQHVKDGTLQLTDIQDLQHMYPNYYQNAVQQLSNQMMSAASEGVQIPYHTKIAMSLFLGQPLDSSMSPTSIVAAQPKVQNAQNQQNTGKTSQSPKASNSLGKSNNIYKTPDQAAQNDRAKRD